MPIINYDNNGRTVYTHTCWLSNRQRRAIYSIPEQNNNLCYYYSLGALSLSAICARRFSVIGGLYSSLGVYTGAAAISGGTFAICKLLMNYRTGSEIKGMIEQNDSLVTPFWEDPAKVKIIGERSQADADKVTYWKRLTGRYQSQICVVGIMRNKLVGIIQILFSSIQMLTFTQRESVNQYVKSEPLNDSIQHKSTPQSTDKLLIKSINYVYNAQHILVSQFQRLIFVFIFKFKYILILIFCHFRLLQFPIFNNRDNHFNINQIDKTQRKQIIQEMHQLNQRYDRILQEVYKESKSKSQSAIILASNLKKKLSDLVKLNVAKDCSIVPAMIDFIKNAKKDQSGVGSLNKKASFINLLNQGLSKQNFYTKKHSESIKKQIGKIFNTKLYSMNQGLLYLRKSTNQADYRSDFIDMIDDRETCIENDQQMSVVYRKFWQQCLEQKVPKRVFLQHEGIFSKFQNRVMMLTPQLIEKIDNYLGDDVGSSEKQVKINQLLVQIAQGNSYDSDTEYKKKLEEQSQILINSLKRFSGLKFVKEQLKVTLRVGKFGSIISGFSGTDADLDLTVLTDCYISQNVILEYLSDFLRMDLAQIEKKTSKRYKIDYIPTANIPLISVSISSRQERSHRGLTKSNIKIDILINNYLGVINSKMLSVYSSIRWIKNLGLLVKLWGKQKRIIDKSQLSSYAVIILLLNFLIKTNRAKRIIDARNRSADADNFLYKRTKASEIQSFRVYYNFKSDSDDVTSLKRVNYLQILKQFMIYYSEQGDHWKQSDELQVISIDGSVDKKMDTETIFTIKDPFDEPHNPGRAKIQSKAFILGQFKEAFNRLQSNREQQIQKLFSFRR